MTENEDYPLVDVVLRNSGDDRELARATVPESSAGAVVAMLNRAIEWGHELSYPDVEPSSNVIQLGPMNEAT